MALLRSRTAAPAPDPTSVTWRVQVSGRCCGGHEVSSTIEVTTRLGFVGPWTGSGQCGACNSDVDLTGWIG